MSKESLQAQFDKYHHANPIVYVLFKKYAMEAWYSGRKKYSAKAIIERIRWHLDIEITYSDEFKINNNHTAFYARMIANEIPSPFAEFFNRRERKI